MVIGIRVSGKAEDIFQKKDSQKIVIDEIAGMLISLFMLPPEFLTILSGFLIFRIIDITKPFHILERLPHGFGVMMDDIAAGVRPQIEAGLFKQYCPLKLTVRHIAKDIAVQANKISKHAGRKTIHDTDIKIATKQ